MLWVSVLFVQCDPHKRFRGLSGPNLEATATLFITITWLMPHYFMTILESIYCYFQKTSATKPRQHWFVGREFFFFFFYFCKTTLYAKLWLALYEKLFHALGIILSHFSTSFFMECILSAFHLKQIFLYSIHSILSLNLFLVNNFSTNQIA